MRVWTFLFLYGMLAFMGAFLVAFWGVTARRRIEIITHPWYQDRYAILCLAIALFTVGTAVDAGARMWGNLQHGLSPILKRLEGEFIGVGMTFVLLGLTTLIWLADLERIPPRYSWLLGMAAVTVIWAIGCLVLAPFVPWTPPPSPPPPGSVL